MPTLIPDLLYRDDAFHTGLALEYDERSGRITRITDRVELDPGEAILLPERALMPGFVNAHSHAFQRLIRGHTQWRPAGAGGASFWTWRDSMYGAAAILTPESLYDVARYCFLEMLLAGITTVGEFHYLHNAADGTPYTDRNELARRVVAAAEAVGMRICLLNVCYATGGIAMPLRPEQRRFQTADLDAYVENTETLADSMVGNPLVTIGVAPHSVRAVPREWVRTLHAWASTRDLPLHMHVSEQPAEVDACLAAYGVRPVELLAEDMLLDDRFTLVHATHINDAEVALLGGSEVTVCVCPTTECDLGDGFARGADLIAAGAQLALGSDSQTVIDMLAETRLVEYTERLRRRERVIIARGTETLDVAPVLLQLATAGGARALRLSAGVLAAGSLADVVAIDLAHPSLAGWTPVTLPALLALSASAAVVSDVWVGGRQVVRAREHAMGGEATRAFNLVARHGTAGR